MKLYYSDVLMPRKACAVARHLGLPVDYVYLDLGRAEHKTPDYLALNPNGKVPTLVDGATTLWESDAIICALAAKAGSDLWPGDGRQIDIIRWLSWNARHFNPPGGELYFEYVIRPRFNLGPPDETRIAAATDEFRDASSILEDHLKTRDWLVGDAPTVADFSTAIVLPYGDRVPLPLEAFPAIRRWHDRLNQFEAWRNPFPVR